MIVICSYCQRLFPNQKGAKLLDEHTGICKLCNNRLETMYERAQTLRLEIDELLNQKQLQLKED